MLNKIHKKQFFIPLLIAVISAVIFLWLIAQRGKLPASPLEEQSWRVNIMIAKPGSYAPEIWLHGVTESPNNSILEAAINADVIKTLAYEGYTVKKGQVLIELDNREVSYLLNQRQAEIKDLEGQIIREKNRHKADLESLAHEKKIVTLAKAAVGRQLELQRKELGSQAAIDAQERTLWLQTLVLRNRRLAVANHPARSAELEAKLARAQALFQQAQLDFSRTKITAPFDGYISKLQVAVGNRVSPGDKLIELYDSNNIEVRAQIPSSYLAIIHQAMPDKKNLTASGILDKQNIKLTLDRLSRDVPRGRGGVDGLFKIIKSSSHIALGRSLEIKLVLPKIDNSYAIPFSALYDDNRIYLANKGRMDVVKIKRVGMMYDKAENENVIIKSSKIKSGDKIIITQLPNARDGLKIEISSDEKQ